MRLNYRAMSLDDVYPKIEAWQNKIDEEMKSLAGANITQLQDWQIALQKLVVTAWWKLADFLVMKYNDGKTNWPTAGKSLGYPEQWARMVGFSNDVRPRWVQPVAVPPVHMDGYVEKTVNFPLSWDSETASWSYAAPTSLNFAASRSFQSPFFFQVAFSCLAVFVGVVMGRVYERRQILARDVYLSMN